MSAAAPDPALEARVAALRRLAMEDALPAVREVVRLCATGGDVVIKREVEGVGRFVGLTEPVRLRFPTPLPPEDGHPAAPSVREAAVVFGALAGALPPAMWRGRPVVELFCGAGYVGLLLAALGAKVVLMDRPELAGLVTGLISRNACVIRPTASAAFCPVDWRQPRALASTRAALRNANVVVCTDPVDSEDSQREFLAFLAALLGLDGGVPLCTALDGLLLVHKHQQTFCISGYSAPMQQARPTITHAEHCGRCTFRRSLEDAGLVVRKLDLATPSEFDHPFVECWELSVRRPPAPEGRQQERTG